MVKPKERVKKKVYRRTPGGVLKKLIKNAKKHKPRCGICKAPLKGTAYARSLRKTEKRPERPFGGYLCHKCSERVIMYRARVKENDMKAADVPLVFQRYL
ncbi:MAG: 50S ribosomal protein L34e [Candidatus Micrarchaeia archaeon]